jgi:hypothetical protein
MENEHVISGLLRKRAELAGELIAIDARAEQLRADLAALDGALRVFDPSIVPANIKPKRFQTQTTPLPHGHPSRMMMDILRKAAKPMTAREIADALAEQCGLAPMPPDKHKALLTKVRNMLARQDGRTVAREERADGAVWRVV